MVGGGEGKSMGGDPAEDPSAGFANPVMETERGYVREKENIAGWGCVVMGRRLGS